MAELTKKCKRLWTKPGIRWLCGYFFVLLCGVGLVYYWRVAYSLGAGMPGFAAATTLIICGGFSAVYLLVFLAAHFLKQNLALKTAVLVFLAGLCFVFANPPMQAPDETMHFLRAYAVGSGQFLFDEKQQFPNDVNLLVRDFPGAYINGVSGEKLAPDDPTIADAFARYSADKAAGAVAPGAFTPVQQLVPYFPQALGVAVGRLFGADALACMYLARAANLLCYAVLCGYAAAVIRRFSAVLIALAISPVSLFMAGSCSSDGLFMGLTWIFIALCLSDVVTKKRLAVLALCFGLTFHAKYTTLALLPLLLLAVMSWIGRDPLGPGMIVNSHLTGLYIAGDIVGLLARAIGGTVLTVWQTIWMGGLLAWVGTAAMMLWSYFKAMRLVTTTYRLQTTKPLPGGKLRVLQISDLHPGKGAVDRKRIPELNRRIRELNPDMILFTGDIFDEHVERPDFDSFNAFFATLDPPGGKWFVLGNHDLFHHWREPSYGRADLEGAFARAHIRILEDVSQLAYVGKDATPVRIVGRKDWLYTQGNRFTPAQLMPNGPDNVYTILLDHEPRELKADAAAGANLILSGHTHGGQIWPTGLVAKLFRYNELNYGMKQITPVCAAIVSGGTGTWGYKIRTEGKTELVMVEIEQKNA